MTVFGSCCCSSSESGKTEFFLGAFASHECAGTDWIGKNEKYRAYYYLSSPNR
jgi:hypothetical protein